MRKTASYELQASGVGKATEFVQHCLQEYGMEPKGAVRGTLIAEEALGSLLAHAAESGQIRISVSRLMGNITVEMSAPGSEYSLNDNMASASLSLEDEVGEEAQDTIRNILLRSLVSDLRYRHKDGTNHIRITIEKSRRMFLYLTLLALAAGAVLGFLLSLLVPASVNGTLDRYIFSPLKTVYLNLLKAIVAPVVFLSIVSCISGFSNLKELGKIGGKTISLYLLTTVLAVITGIGAFYLFKPGQASLANVAAQSGYTASDTQISISSLLLNMVPSNFLKPFLENDMACLIILAVLCGVATGLIGQYSATLKALFDALNELFMKIASLIIRMMPLAVFCSTVSMIIGTGAETILSIMGMFGTFLFGLVCMMVIYGILMIVIGRLNSLPLLRKYAPVMLQVFSMASSNAAIPVNMDACENKLGISRKVYSLSIPLGSTLNMNGTCIQLAVFALALAKVYGVEVPAGNLLAMGITIILLSMGAPGMPGAGIICMTVLLEQLHVPTDAVSLIIGIGPLLGMFLCMSNCLGDVVVSTIVAKTSHALDMDVYQKP